MLSHIQFLDSSFEIHQATGSNTINYIKPVSSDEILQYFVDENYELSISNDNLIYEDIYDFMLDDDIYNMNEPSK